MAGSRANNFVDCAHSKYYQGLNIEAKKRYDVKLGILGSLGDPYSGLKNLPASLEWQHRPSIEYPDITTISLLHQVCTQRINLRHTRVWKRQGLIDPKGEEGMQLSYCSVYLAKFKPDSGL